MLMSERPGSDELIEDFVVHDLEKRKKIQEYFQNEAPILVELDMNRELVSVNVTEDGEDVVSWLTMIWRDLSWKRSMVTEK